MCGGWQLIRAEGVGVLARGWVPFFFRMAPIFTVQMTIYEQCRRLLGLWQVTNESKSQPGRRTCRVQRPIAAVWRIAIRRLEIGWVRPQGQGG